jgi:hypothetical protein
VRLRWRIGSSWLTALAAALAVAAPAAATTSEEAVAFLNQQRALNGIPSNVGFDQYRTTGCYNHNRYMEKNGLGHGEDPGKPGYTVEGADYTNSGEVLARGSFGFTAHTNPWDTAPLHQTLLFDPQVNAAGYDEYSRLACMRFGFDFAAAQQPVLYAFTGDRGRKEVPRSVTVRGEGPYAPQELVGIPQGVPTGPNILFFTVGVSSNHAVPGSFSLRGSGGNVNVKLVDSTTPAPGGGKAFTTGGDMIPVKPLEPLTTYKVAVTWEDGNGQRMPQTLSFKTAGRMATLSLSLSRSLSRKRKATLKAPPAAVGRRTRVKLERKFADGSPRIVTTRQITLKRSQTIAVPKGMARVTATVPSFTAGGTRYTVTAATRTYR